MADVRSMLKASREARRINHPYASYTKDGKLLCSLCEQLIKSEGAWQGHLHSSQHIARQTRAQEAADSRGTNGNAASKKRKADDSPEDAKKKLKAATISIGQEEDEEEVQPVEPKVDKKQPDVKSDDFEKPADADQLAAFERELQQMEASMPKPQPQQIQATISAPAMTGEEIAAQAREEQSTQKERRAAELEGEKEDAAKVLEDEFDEMEELEARARKLRERREMLRKGNVNAAAGDQPALAEAEANGKAEDDPGEDEDEDDEDDEDFDEWNFGAR